MTPGNNQIGYRTGYGNNPTAYERLMEDLDYKLDQMNKAEEAAFNAVNTPAKSSRPSNYNATVRRQQQLKKMGLYNGAIDGDWGKGSKAAHQAALKNGYVLNSRGMYVRKPQAQGSVRPEYSQDMQRQAQLKKLGFYKAAVDGKFGSKSRAAHQAALDAGYVYENGKYTKGESTEKVRGGGGTWGDEQQVLNGRGLASEHESHGIRLLGKIFPAFRQVYDSATSAKSNEVQTNKDFTDKYLENLSQLGQVAYRQYVRKNGYPKPYETFTLPLSPGVYKEINESGRYADFTDMPALANAAVGGSRQVEYTNGGMSGSAYIDDAGNVHWNATDSSRWDFDSDDYKEKFKEDAKSGNIGSAVRYGMGNMQERQNQTEYVPVRQNFDIQFPSDTITMNPARFSNVPRYKQRK